MQSFEYTRVDSVEAAVQRLLQNPGARLVAGGTGLVDLMKLGVEAPTEVVDIHRLRFHDVEELADGSLRIGALATNAAVARHAGVAERFPVLSRALLAGASPQLRNAATVGGNLLQRTRCTYFRDATFECNKRQPGSGCSARQGYHRMHAILGTSEHCIATHPSDMCVALLALDAVVQVHGRDGQREIPMEQFHAVPGDTPHIETALEPGEVVTHVFVPATPFARRSAYLKVRDRASFEFALVSVAAALHLKDGVVEAARIVLGGVGTRPWRAYQAEALLLGEPPTAAHFRSAAGEAVRDAVPLRDNAFKVELVERAIVRTLGGLA